ncbi:MAG: hypothetical protein AAGD14_17505 [Planctomycetota bacterium]
MRTIGITLLLAALPAAAGEKIQWYATLDQARAEAKRLNRPIFLLAAAPHCRNVSGMW